MYNRHVEKELKSFLRIMPVVLITGARQTGKTTLSRLIAKERDLPLFTFDDATTLSNAKRDPEGWVESLPKPLIIDEVQRVPEIFLPIKKDVDENRIPGRYLLTGSANPLLLPAMGDSLAGRLGVVRMYGFSQGELRKKRETFIEQVFASEFPFRRFQPLDKGHLIELFLKGGFPPVHNFSDDEDVKRWINSYLLTLMERDVRDLSNIEALRDFPRLFRLLATRSSHLLNVSDLSRSLGMVNQTLNRYLKLLEILFLITELPAWFTNRGKRLTKAPKLFFNDTAILANLLDADQNRLKTSPELMGQFLETFVYSELMKQQSWSSLPFEIFHFREGAYEVDFVLERRDGTIVGVEVKSAQSIQTGDLKGLRYLKKLGNHHFKRGIILHRGTQIERLDDDIYAMPIQSLWD